MQKLLITLQLVFPSVLAATSFTPEQKVWVKTLIGEQRISAAVPYEQSGALFKARLGQADRGNV